MKRNKNRFYTTGLDNTIFLTYLALCLIGLLVLLDVSSFFKSLNIFYRQGAYFLISLVIVLVITYALDISRFRLIPYLLMIISTVLLVAVLRFGFEAGGAIRQIRIWFISFQPSTITRLALVFFYAFILSKYSEQLQEAKILEFIKRFPVLITMTILSFALIYFQRHFSAFAISGATLFCMLFFAGLRKRILILIVVLGIFSSYLILSHGDEFRKDRIKLFQKHSLFYRDHNVEISPDLERQVEKSLTVMSQGGLLGTGVSRGRAKHFFLPDAHTDYIYSVIGEEFGFLGALLILALHSVLFFQILRISMRQENLYLRYLCAGLGLNIFLNVLVNTGVAMSIIPATGTTLPFISYGGTALVVDSASVGVVLSISAKRKTV